MHINAIDRIHVVKKNCYKSFTQKTCPPLYLGFNQTLHRTLFRPKRPPCVSRVSWTASTTAGILLWIQTWPGSLGNFAEVKLVDLAVQQLRACNYIYLLYIYCYMIVWSMLNCVFDIWCFVVCSLWTSRSKTSRRESRRTRQLCEARNMKHCKDKGSPFNSAGGCLAKETGFGWKSRCRELRSHFKDAMPSSTCM